MRRFVVALVLSMAIGGNGLAAPLLEPVAARQEVVKPNPRLAQPMKREPTQQDIDRVNAAIGKERSEVLRRLGHPSSVKYHDLAGGSRYEEWHYRWGGWQVIRVRFQSDLMVAADCCTEQERQTGVVDEFVLGIDVRY